MGDEQQYQALLSDYFWGVNAVVVNDFVQEYLFSLWGLTWVGESSVRIRVVGAGQPVGQILLIEA